MQLEERDLLSVLYVRPLHILRVEVLQRSFESTLDTAIAVVDQFLGVAFLTVIQRLFQRIQCQAGS